MINTYISSVSVVVSIVLNILLIPKFGIVGAAWATSLSYMANFTIIVLVYRKISGNRIRNTVLVNVSDIKYYFKMFSDITARYWPMPKK